MIIDMAVKVEQVQISLHNRLQAIPICINDLGPHFAGALVDHVDVEMPVLSAVETKLTINGAPNPITGHRVRMLIPISVYYADRNKIIEGGLAGSSSMAKVHIKVTCDLVGEIEKDPSGSVIGAGTRMTYVGKDMGLAAFAINKDLDEKVEKTLSALNDFYPADLAPLEKVLQSSIPIQNFGVAIDPSSSRIVTRIEVVSSEPDPKTSWENFYSNPPDILDGRDWALSIDKRLLVKIAVDRTRTSIENSAELELEEGPSGAWYHALKTNIPGFPVESPPAIGLEMYVSVNCPAIDWDIGVGIKAVTLFALEEAPSGKELRSLTNVRWDAVDSDVLACGAGGGFLGLVTGSILGGIVGAGPVGMAVGGAIGLIGALVAVAAIADTVEPASSALLQPGCKEVEKDDNHILMDCRSPLKLPKSDLVGELKLDELLGTPQGLVLRGSTGASELVRNLSVEVTPLGWEQHLNCSISGVETEMVGGVTLVTSHPGLYVCDVIFVAQEHVGETKDYFTYQVSANEIKIGTKTGIANGIHSEADSQYFTYPYSCKLIIVTTHGARFVDLGVLPERPQTPKGELFIKKMVANCFKEYNQFANKLFAPDWMINPNPGESVMHHWRVVATGLLPSSGVELIGADDRVLVSGHASRHGVAQAQAVVSPDAGLSIRRMRSRSIRSSSKLSLRKFDPAVHHLTVVQRLLVLRRLLSVGGIVRAVTAFAGSGRAQLAAITDMGLEVWDQSPAEGLKHMTVVRGVDFAGITPTVDGFVAFGADGLWLFGTDAVGRARVLAADRGHYVTDAIVVNRHVYSLAADRLDVYGPHLGGRRSVKVSHGDGLTRTRIGVAVRSAGTITSPLFGLDTTGKLIEVGRDVRGSTAMHNQRRQERSFRDQESEALGDTRASQWLAGSIIVSPWLARVTENRSSIELYSRSAHAQLRIPWQPTAVD